MVKSLNGWITFRSWNWCVDITSARRLSEWMSCLLYAVVTKNMRGIQKPINCISLLHSSGLKSCPKIFSLKACYVFSRERENQVIYFLLQPKRGKIWQHLISDYTIPSLNDNYFLWMLISFPAVFAVNRSVSIALGFIYHCWAWKIVSSSDKLSSHCDNAIYICVLVTIHILMEVLARKWASWSVKGYFL